LHRYPLQSKPASVAAATPVTSGFLRNAWYVAQNEPLVIDVPDRHAQFGGMLIANSFVVERHLRVGHSVNRTRSET
jgi:hypothetical protein